jgi:hypothetical protein
MFFEAEQEEGYPATVKIIQEASSLVIQISVKTIWGTFASPNLCGFYDEFGRNLWQALARPQTKQPIPSSQKLLKEERGPSPPPAETVKPSPLSVSLGKVIWVYVNLREGPGTQYRIIGKAYLKNTFEILAENPGWVRVCLESGAVGWMSKKAVSVPSLTPSPQSPATFSNDSSKAGRSSKPPGPM